MTKLEFIRREKGLSQRELARRIGINASAVVQIERRNRKSWPKLRKQLSNALETKEKELFDSDGWPTEIEVKNCPIKQ